MALLTADQEKEVAEAIEDIERQTDAELVVVLARRSDRYLYIPVLWAAMIALLTPAIVWVAPLWITGIEDMMFIQWTVFIAAALLFNIPMVSMRLIPKSVRQWRASNMARRQFLINNLHYTKDETGVLIFVSEAERYVEILADRGISTKVPHSRWQEMVDDLIATIKKGNTREGILRCVQSCGQILINNVPATSQKNELSNKLIVIE